jgi:hypothetical protein
LIPFDSSGSKRIYDRTCPAPLFESNPTFTKLNYSNVLDCIYKADDIKAFLADLDLYDPEYQPDEERRWISGWGVSQKCTLDKRSLAGKILSGELKAYEPGTFEEVDVEKEKVNLGEDPALYQDLLGALKTRVFQLLFRRAAVDARWGTRKPAALNGEPPRTESTQLTPVQKDMQAARQSNARVAIVLKAAKQLRRDYPDMNKVKAKKKIDIILKDHKYAPYSRTNFNRIIKDMGFPPAPRGRKPTDKKK